MVYKSAHRDRCTLRRMSVDRYMEANVVLSKFSRGYMELKKDLPIRPSEMAVLNIITQREGSYTPLMIAELLGVSKPMIAAHVRVLLKEGYVYKKPSAEDGRSFYVLPTDKAIRLADEFNSKQAEYLKKLEAAMGEAEFFELVRLLCAALPTLDGMKE